MMSQLAELGRAALCGENVFKNSTRCRDEYEYDRQVEAEKIIKVA